MGGIRRKRNRPLKERKQRDEQSYKLITLADQRNELFEKYYKAQNIVGEEQWDTFMSTLQRELPSSFRLIGCKSETETLLKLIMKRYISHFNEISLKTDEPIQPPKEIPWYPNGLGFQMKLSRGVVRSHALLSQFHNFLVTETQLGNISRQETVSMIPPLLLDVKPNHKVFDMCAAPGSKTTQLIEMLHADQSQPIPSGFIVANDVDNGRCYLLVKQALKRLLSACCIVTNHDASHMPKILIGEQTSGHQSSVLFDRVLCDVICSGDGTFRKNINIWKNWNSHQALTLHRLQTRIAKRGLELLAPEGLLVYSTCSLNPVENEAVVANLLRFGQGSLELVDVDDQLPSLIRNKGLSHWKIMDSQGNFYENWSEVPEKTKGKIPEESFPPDAKEAEEMCLSRCLRILPHQQDTGGFFVAVIRKKSHFPWFNEKEIEKVPIYRPPPSKRQKGLVYRENPFVFFSDDDERWPELRDHFGLKSELDHKQLLSRTIDNQLKNNLYFVNKQVKQILVNNVNTLKVINAGVRVFGRVEQKYIQCKFRLAQEGLNLIYPHLTQRIIQVPNEDMIKILIGVRNCLIATLTPETIEVLDNVSVGSVCVCTDTNGHCLPLCTWKGKVSISAYAAKETRLHYLRLLDYDTTAIEEEMVAERKGKKKSNTVVIDNDDDDKINGTETDDKKEKDTETTIPDQYNDNVLQCDEQIE